MWKILLTLVDVGRVSLLAGTLALLLVTISSGSGLLGSPVNASELSENKDKLILTSWQPLLPRQTLLVLFRQRWKLGPWRRQWKRVSVACLIERVLV